MSKPSDQIAWPDPDHHPAPHPGSTKDRILRAATELIAERGWGGVTTRAVAERAGVLNGVVSYHFDGKADLLRQAALAGVIETISEPVGVLLSAATVSEGLRAVAGWMTQESGSLPDFALMAESMLEAQRDPALQRLLAAVIEDFRTAVAAKLSNADAAAASAGAAVVTSLLDGLVLHRLVDPEFDPVPALEHLAHLLERTPRRRSTKSPSARLTEGGS